MEAFPEHNYIVKLTFIKSIREAIICLVFVCFVFSFFSLELQMPVNGSISTNNDSASIGISTGNSRRQFRSFNRVFYSTDS